MNKEIFFAIKFVMEIEKMETAKKFLEKNQPHLALERLKKILHGENFADEWKIHELVGACFHDLADAEGAVQAYFNAAKSDTILRSQRTHFSNFLFALHYLPKADSEILFDNAKIYNTLYRDQEILSQKNFQSEKISVGFIAPHFLDSSSARFFESLLTDYDKNKFTVSAWSLSSREDNFTKKIKNSVDKYFNVSQVSFEEVAEKIQSEGADILFDLGGHSEGGMTLQILAWRPASVQISGIGYFDTTGADFIDYFLTDKFLIAGSENNFTEQLFEIENAFAFKPNETMIQAKKTFKKIPHTEIVFGCLNNFMKITDDYLNCVAEILNLVPNAKIIFRDTTPLESRKNALTEKILSAGIENFEVRCGEDNFFSDYGEIDLMLDTFPYSGGMMTALALYFNVPVLNLCGKYHSGRLGAEMIRLAEVDELIAENVDDYIKKAVELSAGENLKNLQKKICVDKLTDTESFVKNFYAGCSSIFGKNFCPANVHYSRENCDDCQ